MKMSSWGATALLVVVAAVAVMEQIAFVIADARLKYSTGVRRHALQVPSSGC
jgi:hypothetical protein